MIWLFRVGFSGLFTLMIAGLTDIPSIGLLAIFFLYDMEHNMIGEFSVCSFFQDESYEYDLRFVDAKTAVNRAQRIIESVGGRLGLVARVIITDAGDAINWEWKFGEGIVYPTKEDLKGYEQ